MNLPSLPLGDDILGLKELIGENLDLLKSNLKSDEEISRLTTDEALSEVDKAVVLLSSGTPIQQQAALAALPTTARSDPDATSRRVFPKLQKILSNPSPDFSSALSSSLNIILKDRTFSQDVLTTKVYPLVMAMAKVRDSKVRGPWLDSTIPELIQVLNPDFLLDKVLPDAMAKSDLSEPVTSRHKGTILLCLTLPRLHAFSKHPGREVHERLISLCQDTDSLVRQTVAKGLPAIVRSAVDRNNRFMHPEYAAELFELLDDEEEVVQSVSLNSLIATMDILPSDVRASKFIPAILTMSNWHKSSRAASNPRLPPAASEICKSAEPTTPAYKFNNKPTSAVLCTLTSSIGHVVYGLSSEMHSDASQNSMEGKSVAGRALMAAPSTTSLSSTGSMDGNNSHQPRVGPASCSLSENDVNVLIALFLTQAYCPTPSTRAQAAYHFPGVIKGFGRGRWSVGLSQAYKDLATDTDPAIRRSIAAGFAAVTTIVGNDLTVESLLPTFVALLKDSDRHVAEALLPDLSKAMASFTHSSNSQASTSAYAQILPALQALQATIEPSWRDMIRLLTTFQTLPDHYSSDVIYSKVIPPIWVWMKSHAAPVQIEAARTLLTLLRRSRRASHRDEITQGLVSFATAASHSHRSLYVDICEQAMTIFSRKFFKESFLKSLLLLADDKVPNVRIKLCRLIPALKRIMKIPNDAGFLHKLDEAILDLKHSSDRDVSQFAEVAAADMSKYEPKLTRENALQSVDEIVDKKKEEEEQQWVTTDLPADDDVSIPGAEDGSLAKLNGALGTPTVASRRTSVSGAPAPGSLLGPAVAGGKGKSSRYANATSSGYGRKGAKSPASPSVGATRPSSTVKRTGTTAPRPLKAVTGSTRIRSSLPPASPTSRGLTSSSSSSSRTSSASSNRRSLPAINKTSSRVRTGGGSTTSVSSSKTTSRTNTLSSRVSTSTTSTARRRL